MLNTISKFERELRGTLPYKVAILEKQLDAMSNAKVRDTELRALAHTLQSLHFDVIVTHSFDSDVYTHRIYATEITADDVLSAQNFLNMEVALNKSLSVKKIIETLFFLGLMVEKDDSGYYEVWLEES